MKIPTSEYNYTVLLLVSIPLLFFPVFVFAQTEDNVLTVIFIDLGREGDSTLVIFPNNNAMLIDGGLKFDLPFERLMSVLEENEVEDINLIISTHADADHVGGLARLLREDSTYHNNIEEVLASHLPHTTEIYKEFVRNVQSHEEIVYSNVTAPLDIGLGNPVSVEIISPPIEGIRSHSDHASELNSNSLVARMEYGDVSFLFTADTTWTTEEWLVENQSDLIDVDIMNAPHHGTKYASDYRDTNFIESTNASLIILSADVNNRYEHPDPNTIERYEEVGAITLQTGKAGNVVIKTDGIGCNLILDGLNEEPCPGFSLMSIKPESIPENEQPEVIEDLLISSPEDDVNGEPEPEGGCLIATAAFGSELAPQVQMLREIRDNTVLGTSSGTAFMTGFNQFYYSFSPTVADWERENPVFKEAVKITISPLLTSLSILNYVNMNSEIEVLGYGIGVILLNIGMYFVAPAILIIKLKQRSM